MTVPGRTQHRRGMLLVALGVFQLWLWGTRIVNLLGESDGFSAAFVAVHLTLYIAAIGAGLLLLGLGWAQLREVRDAEAGKAAPPPREDAGAGPATREGARP